MPFLAYCHVLNSKQTQGYLRFCLGYQPLVGHKLFFPPLDKLLTQELRSVLPCLCRAHLFSRTGPTALDSPTLVGPKQRSILTSLCYDTEVSKHTALQ